MKPANKIRQARHAAGLTQEQLARACGCGVRNVPAWEAGQRHPRTAMLQKIAAACGVKVADLVEPEPESEAAMARVADILTAALQAALRSATSEALHDRRHSQAPISADRRSGDRRAVSA